MTSTEGECLPLRLKADDTSSSSSSSSSLLSPTLSNYCTPFTSPIRPSTPTPTPMLTQTSILDDKDVDKTSSSGDIDTEGDSEYRGETVNGSPLRIYCLTWNIGNNSSSLPSRQDLINLLFPDNTESADIYVLSFQEMIELNIFNLLFSTIASSKPAPGDRLSSSSSCDPIERWRHELDSAFSSRTEQIRKEARSIPDCSEPLCLDKETVTKEGIDPTSVAEGEENFVDVELEDSLANENVIESTDSETRSPLRVETRDVRSRNKANTGSIEGEEYTLVQIVQLVGLVTFVYARKCLVDTRPSPTSSSSEGDIGNPASLSDIVWSNEDVISDLRIAEKRTGLMGLLGNKGAVAVRLSLLGISICFVNSHFSADKHLTYTRNDDFKAITEELSFAPLGSEGVGKRISISDHDLVIWTGDLNYRLSIPDGTFDILSKKKEKKKEEEDLAQSEGQAECKMGGDEGDGSLQNILSEEDSVRERSLTLQDMGSSIDLPNLFSYDQLEKERSEGRVFSGYEEGKVSFSPTYRFIAGTDVYDSPKREPAWCDRILWRVSNPIPSTLTRRVTVDQEMYDSPPIAFSDHMPVRSVIMCRLETSGMSYSSVNERGDSSGNTPTIQTAHIETPQSDSYWCYFPTSP